MYLAKRIILFWEEHFWIVPGLSWYLWHISNTILIKCFVLLPDRKEIWSEILTKFSLGIDLTGIGDWSGIVHLGRVHLSAVVSLLSVTEIVKQSKNWSSRIRSARLKFWFFVVWSSAHSVTSVYLSKQYNLQRKGKLSMSQDPFRHSTLPHTILQVNFSIS